ncbi:GNAT family N-acetyltransferase [Peptoniphilaceae bacterium SGI.137]
MIRIEYEPRHMRSAAYDEDKNIGEATYNEVDGVWVLDHTGVDPEYGGQGIAKKMVAKLADAARKADLKIVPLCPFARKEFEEKPEYNDIWAK